jgi:hypothetical protein
MRAQQHSVKYLTMAKIAKDYLAIQDSAVASERSFSSGGITGMARRNCLLPETFEALQLHIIRVISLLLLRQNSLSLILVTLLIQICNLFSISIFLDFSLVLPSRVARNMNFAHRHQVRI